MHRKRLFLTSSLLLILATWPMAGPASARQQDPYQTATSLGGPDFEGSVPATTSSAGLLPLSMARAIDLGLANNLGLLLRSQAVTSARGERWSELSRLLPHLTTSGSFHHQKESIAITGIPLMTLPPVTDPFNYWDARIYLSQRIFDLEAIKRSQSAGHQLSAAEFSEKDARELVVVAVAAAYLRVLAGYARVETVSAQLVTANTILQRAVEMHAAGVTPGIDELRARVEALTRTQQLIVAQNELAKDKLTLLRAIGLPVGQEIVLTDQSPFQPLAVGSLDDLFAQALGKRDDYRAAEQLLKAAETAHQAALAERLPSLVLEADYGQTGLTLSSLYGTYHIVGSIKIPIFEGGKVHADELKADAQLKQRRDELADLRGRIEYEIRTSMLDLQAAVREVEVARSNVQLAELALSQAQERFAAGINDNLEVVQAQQTVAAAHEALVTSNYQLNLAKLLLARAVGIASSTGRQGT
ncbi:TolC family protein [Geomonas sp.]|uniref:TolC family protein n=1 Tax=Geomonas sp. TaxID=2651584 RepID=UPI002B49C410|nr:TolC family protein [Geomonas sp.]HJV34198.1 TolC family protein [Geomonas sp.]